MLEFLVDKENIALHQSCSEAFDYIFIRHRPTTKCLTGVRLVGPQTSSFLGFNKCVKAPCVCFRYSKSMSSFRPGLVSMRGHY